MEQGEGFLVRGPREVPLLSNLVTFEQPKLLDSECVFGKHWHSVGQGGTVMQNRL